VNTRAHENPLCRSLFMPYFVCAGSHRFAPESV